MFKLVCDERIKWENTAVNIVVKGMQLLVSDTEIAFGGRSKEEIPSFNFKKLQFLAMEIYHHY